MRFSDSYSITHTNKGKRSDFGYLVDKNSILSSVYVTSPCVAEAAFVLWPQIQIPLTKLLQPKHIKYIRIVFFFYCSTGKNIRWIKNPHTHFFFCPLELQTP